MTSETGMSPQGESDGGAGLRVLLLTGLSGAGRTLALKSLEDLGYEAVDNLPLSLLGRLLEPIPIATRAIRSIRNLAMAKIVLITRRRHSIWAPTFRRWA